MIAEPLLPKPYRLKSALLFSHQVLSVAQLEALGPDNAVMITSEQKAELKDDQLSALERASTGSLFQSRNSTLSGKKTHVHSFVKVQPVRFVTL